MAVAEGDQAEQVDGEAAEQGEGGDVVEVLVVVGDRRLQAEGDEDDPGDHQQVDVGVGVAGELVLRPPDLGFAEPPGRDQGDDVEVGPPERRGEEDAEHGGGADPEVEGAGGADPDRDDRLAEGDDDDQAVALGEVAGDELPALGAEEVGTGHVEEDRQRPERPLGEAVEERGDDEEADRDRGAGGEADHRAAQVVVVGAGEPEEGDVGGAEDADREGEGEAEVAEGLLDAERDDQHRRHRREDDQADRALLGVDDAGQPGVADPGPPEHAEDQQALRQSRPGLVVGHQRRALGDREDEDEVEEELQRRHPLALAADGARAGGCGSGDACTVHPRSIDSVA